MLVSLIAAVVAAVFYGVASVMQAIAVRAASNREPDQTSAGVDPGLVVRMLHQWRFLVSICLDALGFIAQLVALQRLPLFVVQAFVASNLAVTAVVASWLIGVKLSWREWAAVIGVVAGVALLGSTAGAEGAAQVGAVFKLALIVAIAGLAVVGLAAAKLNEPYRTTALGLVAGLGFGVLSIAARVLDGFSPLELARDPAAYAIAAAGIISFMFYATALEGGSVTVATAAVVLAETIPPAVIGDENLAVLEGVHRARIDIQIRIELLHIHPQPSELEQPAQAGRGESFAEAGCDPSGDEEVPGQNRPWME